jgi:uncharacterized repeat protein (TIGR04138 family)
VSITMHEIAAQIVATARKDGRFAPQAFFFILEALEYAHKVLQMGRPQPSEKRRGSDLPRLEGKHRDERHLTGQELCEAIRLFALEQFGLMAKTVLNQWGVHTTGDFGEIVFAMIRAQQMKKTPDDRREDFDDVFDFDLGLTQDFRISIPEEA